jgi:hypothetical protein
MSTTHNFPSTARILNVSSVELVFFVEMTNNRTLPSYDIQLME